MAGSDSEVQTLQESEPPGKKQKVLDKEIEDLVDLSSFKADRILSCDSRSKTITAVGTLQGPGERAIVVLEKKAFDADKFEELSTHDTTFKKVFRNDVYGNYDCFIPKELNSKFACLPPSTTFGRVILLMLHQLLAKITGIKYYIFPFAAVKATVICPASEKHIQKYETQQIHIIEETPEVYQTVTLPYLEKEQLGLQVMSYNIQIQLFRGFLFL